MPESDFKTLKAPKKLLFSCNRLKPKPCTMADVLQIAKIGLFVSADYMGTSMTVGGMQPETSSLRGSMIQGPNKLPILVFGVPCYAFRSPVHAQFALGFKSLSLRFLQGFLIPGFGFTGARRVFALRGLWVEGVGGGSFRHVRSFTCCSMR